MSGHKWTPIRPLQEWDVEFDFSEIDSLNEQWLSTKARVEASTPDAYAAFIEKLYRRWSIETGVIEGIFHLDRGITETLVERGITADYIERQGTDREPVEVVRIIDDHQTAVDFIGDWIENGRPLSKWFIRKIHAITCANQDTFRAVNQFGQWFDATLNKGEFKTQPNNPTRPDGSLHEYTPPEQVESEMDQLISFYEEADSRGLPSLLVAAWLHHAFSTIHPFQDGNGRVGRALLTWHLVKHEFLPIVISRDTRAEYIGALESTDRGQISKLVNLLVRVEKGTILEALGQPSSVGDADILEQVMDGIADRLNRQREGGSERLYSVDDVALTLRQNASGYLESKSSELKRRLAAVNVDVSPRVSVGGPDEETEPEHQYRPQILKTASSNKYRVNFNEPSYFVRMIVSPSSESKMPQLVFVVSLHHTGPLGAGVMAASAFAEIHYPPLGPSADETGDDSLSSLFRDCTLEPFTVTWGVEPDKYTGRFDSWLEERLSVALRYWGEFLES